MVVIIGPGREYLSGISYYTWKLCDTLGATPILFRDMLPKFLFPGKDRVNDVENKIQYGPHVSLDWWNPVTWYRALKVCKKHDVIVFQWWSASVAHMYAFILAFCGQRIVIEIHETIDPLESRIWPIKVYARVMRRIIWGRADILVVHNMSDFLTLALDYDIVHKIRIIPHGVYDQYDRVPIDLLDLKDTYDILFFGLVRDYKGVKYLVEAFKESNLPNTRLWIVGEHWDKADYLKDTDLDNIIIIDRYVDDIEIEYLFSLSDVVVLPYTRASSSGVAHIAMHYGLPIISTRVGGLSDLWDYKGMIYISKDNIEDLESKLRYAFYHCKGKRFPLPERLEWSSIKELWVRIFSKISSSAA